SHAGANRTALRATRWGEAVSPPAAKHLHESESITRPAAAFAPVPTGRAPGAGAPRRYPKKTSGPVASHGDAAPAGTASGNTSRVDSGAGRTTAPRGVVAWLRATRVFPSGQRGYGARAGRRGLRGFGSGGAALLRGSSGARGR